jgi:hypothetical protein
MRDRLGIVVQKYNFALRHPLAIVCCFALSDTPKQKPKANKPIEN